jgi:hypothetical protein
LRSISRESIKHDSIPILCRKQYERGDESVDERIEVVSHCANDFLVSESTTEHLHSKESIDKDEKH